MGHRELEVVEYNISAEHASSIFRVQPEKIHL